MEWWCGGGVQSVRTEYEWEKERRKDLQGEEEAEIKRGGEDKLHENQQFNWGGGADTGGEMDDWIDHRQDKYASEYLCGGARLLTMATWNQSKPQTLSGSGNFSSLLKK